ncbi:hypothetical protein CLV34_3067 [Luteimicrobium subarcticum]|uniref:Uncharacterized protein n=1 Tax=Luteimicrobium subarcticum TaxID=620910 RepID=A0A2M8W1L2_9MICO|nr:hypothetical protein CLV34_3067 [Luteimicrobium subarcticum]
MWRHVGHEVDVRLGDLTYTEALPFSCPGAPVVVATRPDASGGTDLGADPDYAVEVRNLGDHDVVLAVADQPGGAAVAFEQAPLAADSVALDGRPVAVSSSVDVPAGGSVVLRVDAPRFSRGFGDTWSGTAVAAVDVDATRLGITTTVRLRLPEVVAAATEGFPFDAVGAQRQQVCERLGASTV